MIVCSLCHKVSSKVYAMSLTAVRWLLKQWWFKIRDLIITQRAVQLVSHRVVNPTTCLGALAMTRSTTRKTSLETKHLPPIFRHLTNESLRPVHTNPFSKTSGSQKTDKKIRVHTSLFTSFSAVHTRHWKGRSKDAILLLFLLYTDDFFVLMRMLGVQKPYTRAK